MKYHSMCSVEVRGPISRQRGKFVILACSYLSKLESPRIPQYLPCVSEKNVGFCFFRRPESYKNPQHLLCNSFLSSARKFEIQHFSAGHKALKSNSIYSCQRGKFQILALKLSPKLFIAECLKSTSNQTTIITIKIEQKYKSFIAKSIFAKYFKESRPTSTTNQGPLSLRA